MSKTKLTKMKNIFILSNITGEKYRQNCSIENYFKLSPKMPNVHAILNIMGI